MAHSVVPAPAYRTLTAPATGPTPLLTTFRGMLHSPLPIVCRQGVSISLRSGQNPFWRNETLPSSRPAQGAPLRHVWSPPRPSSGLCRWIKWTATDFSTGPDSQPRQTAGHFLVALRVRVALSLENGQSSWKQSTTISKWERDSWTFHPTPPDNKTDKAQTQTRWIQTKKEWIRK